MSRVSATVRSLEYDAAELYLPPDAHHILMSTIVLTIQTPEGLVLASDGRKCGSDYGQILSEDVQKIFPIEHPNASLAYGLIGTIRLGNESDTTFDFSVETAVQTSLLAKLRPRQRIGGITSRDCPTE